MMIRRFMDENKRVGRSFANKIMIDKGCAMITISQFLEKLMNLMIIPI